MGCNGAKGKGKKETNIFGNMELKDRLRAKLSQHHYKKLALYQYYSNTQANPLTQ